MHTSRASRQTAHVVNALFRSPNLGSRRSTRQSNGRVKEEDEEDAQDGQDGSQTPAPVADANDSGSVESRVLGKRKRGGANSDAGTTSTSTERAARQSPRQARQPSATPVVATRKPKRQPARPVKDPNGVVVGVSPPTGWEEMYNVTAAMRKRIVAPVDTMGCESLAETQASPRDQRLQTLVSLMLSSQTKDTVTAAAMKNLQTQLPGGLCLEALQAVEPAELNRLIEKVGFHNNKTKYIKAAAIILRDQYRGDIPESIEGLVSLPGVGPKMAYLCMSAAWGRDEGIGVDVHVHRITNLWGWHKTNSPEQTRAALEAWLPKDKWHAINHLLVGLGQTVCLPVGRKCGECDLAERKLCPGAVPSKKRPEKQVKKEEIVIAVEDDGVVKMEQAAVEVDDVGAAVQVKTEHTGEIHWNEPRSDVLPDIEGEGAGTVRKLVRRALEKA